MKHFYYLMLITALWLPGAYEASAAFTENQLHSNSWDALYKNDAVKSSYGNCFSGGGTAANPYLINSANDLAKLAWAVKGGVNEKSSGKHFKLTADIDLNARNWERIGHESVIFEGVFDGDGHTIRNMKIDLTDHVRGLFGATKNATIKNLKMASANIFVHGYDDYRRGSGIIIGKALGNTVIENCHVMDSRIQNEYSDMGGFIGIVEGGISISRSSCHVTLNPRKYRTGGFVGSLTKNGSSPSHFTDCIFTGTMLVDDGGDNMNIGFLIGQVDGGSLNLTRCVVDGRFDVHGNTATNWGRFIGCNNASTAITMTNVYSVDPSSATHIPNNLVSGEGSYTTSPGHTSWTATTIHAADKANFLNTQKGGDKVWEVYNGKLTTNSVRLTTPSGVSYSPHTFRVTMGAANNSVSQWCYPNVTEGTVSNASGGYYASSYKGNKVWELTATSERVTVSEGR
ncbi:MAG: hypothetical protein LBO71_00545, partial [Prevotellaceae bacterium]|nr:hypothetical protein [Prevotellaceae bacterium]